MAKYFTNIPLEPENLRPLQEAVIKNVVEDENIRSVLTIKRVKSGDPLAIIGEMDAVGHPSQGCCPEYGQAGINNALQRWALGDWDIALEICYNDLEDTIAEYCLKAGTDIGDLSGTDFMAIFTEMLSTQIKRMIWRQAWFGDTNADTITNGGQITNTEDPTLFKINDGILWNLAANATSFDYAPLAAATTYAEQNDAIMAKGAACHIIDNLLFNAPASIGMSGDAQIVVNKRFAQALSFDIKRVYGQIMPWDRVFDGVEVAYYNGVRVVSVAVWDFISNKFFNTGTAWEYPFIAVYSSPRNLLLGCDADDPVSRVDIWFDKNCRTEKVYAAGKLDTKVVDVDNAAIFIAGGTNTIPEVSDGCCPPAGEQDEDLAG